MLPPGVLEIHFFGETISQRRSTQTQRIANYRQRAKTHSGARPDRADEDTKDRIQNPRRYWNAHDVIDKSEKQVLPDGTDRLATQAASGGDGPQVAVNESHRGAFHGHVGARAQSDADVGL